MLTGKNTKNQRKNWGGRKITLFDTDLKVVRVTNIVSTDQSIEPLFDSDLEALIVLIIIGALLYLINALISLALDKIKQVRFKEKNIVNFGLRLASIIIIISLIIYGFPIIADIPAEYRLIILGAISTALAFAFSEIFSNFIAGVFLYLIDPFDIGDVVKIQGYKGVIKSISLTRVVVETFDRIPVEFSNSTIINSQVLNYTIHLKNKKNYFSVRKQLRTPQDVSWARLDFYEMSEEEKKKVEAEHKELFETLREKNQSKIYAYRFNLRFPYKRFRIIVEEVNQLCEKYKEVFGFKPRFHIMGFGYEIIVKFHLITLDWMSLLNHQADFAEEIYKIISNTKEL